MRTKVLLYKSGEDREISASHETIPRQMDCFHFHKKRELCFVESGRSDIITEEGRFSADGPFITQYPEGMLHAQRNDPEVPYSRWLVSFDPCFLRELFGARLTDSFFVLNLDKKIASGFRMIFGLIIESELGKEADTVDEHVKFLIAAMYAELIPLIPQNASLKSVPSNQKRIFDICRYIDTHFAERLTLDILSREFFIGRATLVRGFRQVLDMTVGDYIQNVRISKAKRLLMMGKSIAEVADECGYVSPSYFVQVFRRAENLTPASYVESCRQMLESSGESS